MNSWRFGATDYYYTQLEDDEKHGARVADSKTTAFAVGPDVQYQFFNGRGPMLSMSWIKDVYSRNKADSETLWLNAAVKF